MDSDYLHNLVNVLYNIHRTGVNIFILDDFNFPNVEWSNYSSSPNFDSILLNVYLIVSGLNLVIPQLDLRMTVQQYLIYLPLLFLNLLDTLQFSQENFPQTIC